MGMVITVTSDDGAQGPQATAVGTDLVRAAEEFGECRAGAIRVDRAAGGGARVHQQGRQNGTDRRRHLRWRDRCPEQRQAPVRRAVVHDRDGVTVRAGGDATVYWQVNEQTQKDLLLMESLALPLSFLVLVWVFGGLFAAALPVAVGGFAILGAMASLRAVSLFANVSIFALNLTVAMGMALAIDYTLLILSRFRDELAEGQTRDAALIRTMATAGRTVLFSAMTVALSMADAGAVPAVLPEIVRLRGGGGGRVRGGRGDHRDAGGDRAAG